MFTGLSAFPLTPIHDDAVDTVALERLVRRLAEAGVDSITALGSTGSYAYLSRAERQQVVATAVGASDGTPVFAGIGALRTSHAVQHALDAQEAGAVGVLLAPLTYQALTEDDVFGLYADVLEHLSVPLIVYDNPGTTHFTFTDELYGRLAALPGVASIKIPGIPSGQSAEERVRRIREVMPPEVTIGISGDAFAADALLAGCDAWYSVLGGTLPEPALRITRAALMGDAQEARAASARLQPLWDLFGQHGSLRVVAAIAEQRGWAPRGSLPLPIRGLDEAERDRVAEVLAAVEAP